MDSALQKKVAITGGIGSGKSLVSGKLRDLGVDVYDCDAAAKRLMRTSLPLMDGLVKLVGEDAYIDGKLNKAAIARYMMASEENTRNVNQLIHPAVGRDFIFSGMQWMECAILFESGFQKYVDVVVCVTAPRETRIKRVMERDGIPREKVLEWMAKQLPQHSVAKRSDFVIVNDGKTDVDKQISQMLAFVGNQSTGSCLEGSS